MEEFAGEGRGQASAAAGREHVHGDVVAVAVVLVTREGGRLDGFEALAGGRLGGVMLLLFGGLALAMLLGLVGGGFWSSWWREFAAEDVAEALVFFVGASWRKGGLVMVYTAVEGTGRRVAGRTHLLLLDVLSAGLVAIVMSTKIDFPRLDFDAQVLRLRLVTLSGGRVHGCGPGACYSG